MHTAGPEIIKDLAADQPRASFSRDLTGTRLVMQNRSVEGNRLLEIALDRRH